MTLMCLKENLKKKCELFENEWWGRRCVCVCAVGYMMKYVDTVGIWTSACCQSQPYDITVLLFWSMWCKKNQSCALMTASVICFIFSTQSLKRSIRRIPYSRMGHSYLAIAHSRHSESKAVLRFMAHVHQQAIQWTKVFRLLCKTNNMK